MTFNRKTTPRSRSDFDDFGSAFAAAVGAALQNKSFKFLSRAYGSKNRRNN